MQQSYLFYSVLHLGHYLIVFLETIAIFIKLDKLESLI